VAADHRGGTPGRLAACREAGDSVVIGVKSTRTHSCRTVRRCICGRPPQDGPLLQGTRPKTQCDPSATWEATDQQGRGTRVSRFTNGHFQHERDLLLSAIRVEGTLARDTRRDSRVSCCLTLDEEQAPRRYDLQFSRQHLVRFWKQNLLWTRAHMRTPAPFLLWSWVRVLGLHALLPREARERPVTPRQALRVMPSLLSQPGIPVRLCRPRRKAPGGANGFCSHPAQRNPAIYNTRNTQEKSTEVRVTCMLATSAFHTRSSFLHAECAILRLRFSGFCLNISR
jgi:hypothetical protein